VVEDCGRKRPPHPVGVGGCAAIGENCSGVQRVMWCGVSRSKAVLFWFWWCVGWVSWFVVCKPVVNETGNMGRGIRPGEFFARRLRFFFFFQRPVGAGSISGRGWNGTRETKTIGLTAEKGEEEPRK